MTAPATPLPQLLVTLLVLACATHVPIVSSAGEPKPPASPSLQKQAALAMLEKHSTAKSDPDDALWDVAKQMPLARFAFVVEESLTTRPDGEATAYAELLHHRISELKARAAGPSNGVLEEIEHAPLARTYHAIVLAHFANDPQATLCMRLIEGHIQADDLEPLLVLLESRASFPIGGLEGRIFRQQLWHALSQRISEVPGVRLEPLGESASEAEHRRFVDQARAFLAGA